MLSKTNLYKFHNVLNKIIITYFISILSLNIHSEILAKGRVIELLNLRFMEFQIDIIVLLHLYRINAFVYIIIVIKTTKIIVYNDYIIYIK